MERIRIRIQFEGGHSLGRGKAQLLETVAELGSISAAARSMGMAYRHAWELIDDLNQCFGEPVVATTTGGRAGGGASLTPLGAELVQRFRSMERATARSIARDLAALDQKRLPQKSAQRAGARAKRASRGH
jgi:molybdate transport system regulatory protein